MVVRATWVAALLLPLSVASCGLLVSFDGYDPGIGGYTLGGTVDGLEGGAQVTLIVGADVLPPIGNGPFAFASALRDRRPYRVTPRDLPGYVCSIENDTGRVESADVTGVHVHCRSRDASLSSLSVDGFSVAGPFGPVHLSLTPGFVPTHLDYGTTPGVPEHLLVATKGSVTATTASPSASLRVAGQPTMSGVAGIFGPLGAASQKIDVTVTAAAGDVRSYSVTVSADPRAPDYLKPSNTPDQTLPAVAVHPQFGNSVAISGDTLAVGAPGESSNATGINGNQKDTSAPSAGAVYIFTRSGAAWSQQAYVKASNTFPGANFGYSVALDGDTLVVGSHGEASNATGINGNQGDRSQDHAGAVYVFTRSGTTWSQQAYIKASNTRAAATFGFSVALDGDTLIAGAYGEASNATGINGNQSDVSAPYSGAAYVFTRSGASWSQQAYVKASNPRPSASFGQAVALSKDTLVVGSPNETSSATGIDGNQSDGSTSNAGAVYAFVRSGSVWSQQAYVKASNTQQDAQFGGAVAVSADTFVVGAQGEASGAKGADNAADNATGTDAKQSDRTADGAGAAYVLVRSGTAWSQQAYLKASNTTSSASFGFAVAIEGDTLVVGAANESSSGTGIDGAPGDTQVTQAGAAYVFFRGANRWSQQWSVKAPSARRLQNFGWSVAVSRDTLVVGAEGDSSTSAGVNGDPNIGSAQGAGAVFVY